MHYSSSSSFFYAHDLRVVSIATIVLTRSWTWDSSMIIFNQSRSPGLNSRSMHQQKGVVAPLTNKALSHKAKTPRSPFFFSRRERELGSITKASASQRLRISSALAPPRNWSSFERKLPLRSLLSWQNLGCCLDTWCWSASVWDPIETARGRCDRSPVGVVIGTSWVWWVGGKMLVEGLCRFMIGRLRYRFAWWRIQYNDEETWVRSWGCVEETLNSCSVKYRSVA